MNLEELLKARYATKIFDKREIPQEKINKLVEMITLTPSSYNLQPWKIKIVKDQELKEKLFYASYNQEQVRTCSHLLVFCANLDIESNIKLLEQKLLEREKKEKIEPYINMLKEFAFSTKGEKRLSWAQRQLYLAAQTALLAAKYLGFDSCPMEGFEPKKYSEILKLPQNLVPTIIIPLGYAADKPRPKIRFSVDEILV
ncbi:MAG: nitroreductase family protein [Candidatus Anstonellaceae archaeon]